MDLDIYEVIKSAYRSRLLFRTEAEYRRLVGVSFETIRDCRDDEAALERYYDILNRECRQQCGENLYAMVAAYIEASDICTGQDFDWMERRQLASRKKFCRWLFRTTSTAGKRMTLDEESRFSPKRCDAKLFEAFYPDGIEGGRAYDLVFVLLITFGVIKPYSLSSARSRDISAEEAAKSCDAMTALVTTLRDDTPQMGVLPKPGVFDISLEQLRQDEVKGYENYSIARLWNMLNTIEDACIAVSSPQKLAETNTEITGYSMPGIWVDDADRGKSRFWIFPENKFMAFCYQKSGAAWELIPYEFSFYSQRGDNDMDDTCIFITAKGNEQVIDDGGIMQSTEIVPAKYHLGEADEYGSFGKISFEIETRCCPEWFNWHSFKRLPRASTLHQRFMHLSTNIYNPESPHSHLFRNTAPFLTDALDALVATDGDFLYVSDLPKPDKYILRCDKDDNERFWYEPYYKNGEPSRNLRNLVISSEHPLYIIPGYFNLDKHTTERKRRFAEAVMNTELSNQVTIYHTSRHPRGVLCFNNFSVTFPLDNGELESYGVEIITDRKEFFR